MSVIQAVELLPGDIGYAPIELAVFQKISARAGFERAAREEKASVIFLYRPEEPELLGIVSKLAEGKRVIAYNDQSQVDALSLKSFQKVTACLFDHDSKRSEEHKSEIQSLLRISYAVFCLIKKKQTTTVMCTYDQS